MKAICYVRPCSLIALTMSLFTLLPASAHLMVAQHGTLNFAANGVYMVLSLPATAFADVDDDRDGKLSASEISRHRTALIGTIKENVTLTDHSGPRPLTGVMLSLAASHEAPESPVDQLIVLGRFGLAETDSEFRFHVGLYGSKPSERVLEITATRASDNQKSIFNLSPHSAEVVLFR